jgi:hypothetical protein
MAEFMAVVDEITKVKRKTLAWRGQADAGWALTSSLFRKTVTDQDQRVCESALERVEEDMLAFCRSRWQLGKKPSLQILAELQDSETPTRLIPVTHSPMVAMFFASDYKTNTEADEHDGRLYVFEPSTSLNRVDPDTTELPWGGVVKGSWVTEPPCVWHPPTPTPKQQIQEQAYLVGGVPKSGGNSVPVRVVEQTQDFTVDGSTCLTLRVPAESKVALRQSLREGFGIQWSTLYPGIHGMSKAVQRWMVNVMPDLDGVVIR